MLCCTGCASIFIRDFDRAFGSTPTTGEKVGAAAFDVVTLPVQAVVIPPILIKDKLVDEPKREKAREAAEEDSRMLQANVSILARDPEIAVSGDYLNRSASSYEYRALCRFVQTNVTNSFPYAFFRYLYEHANTKPHQSIFVAIMRNPNIPREYLNAEYGRLMAADRPDESIAYSLVANLSSGTDQLAMAASHPNERVRRAATHYLQNRYVEIAADPSTDITLIMAFSTNAEGRIRAAVALNPMTPANTLVQMRSDEYFDVRRNLAKNPNTPNDVLTLLSSDYYQIISSEAQRSLSQRAQNTQPNRGTEEAEPSARPYGSPATGSPSGQP